MLCASLCGHGDVCVDLSPRSVCIWKGGVNPCLCVCVRVCVCVCVYVCVCFNHQGLLANE